MRIWEKVKDGGPDSPVIAYVLIEIKSLFSVMVLHFTGTRENYHSHAFNAVTVWLKGRVKEMMRDKNGVWSREWKARNVKFTPRNLLHKIFPYQDSWALSFRGPWQKYWREYNPTEKTYTTLTHGRKIVGMEEYT